MPNDTQSLPPNCPEAERGVLGCCLLDINKTAMAIKAGVTQRWFYETRHAELFGVLCAMAASGGGDLIVATVLLRERGKLESVGGVGYLVELQDGVPSAENLDYSGSQWAAFSSSSNSSKRTEKFTNPSSTANGSDFRSTPETLPSQNDQ